MALVKSILFIDGENFVFRYQDMLANGYQPIDQGIIHIENVFVWHPNIIRHFLGLDFLRISYYTSIVGDDNKIAEIKNQMANVVSWASGSYYGDCQIYPHVYKKSAKNNKSRLVDINIVIDIMRYVYMDSIDAVCLISGDGDYLNLMSEVMRKGKKMYVGALSSGLNVGIKSSVDRFIDLDEVLFKPH